MRSIITCQFSSENRCANTLVKQLLDHGVVEIVQLLAIDSNVIGNGNVFAVRHLPRHLLADQQAELLEPSPELLRTLDLCIVTAAEVDERLGLRRHLLVAVKERLLGVLADTLSRPVDDHCELLFRARRERKWITAYVSRYVGFALPVALVVDEQIDVVNRADDSQWYRVFEVGEDDGKMFLRARNLAQRQRKRPARPGEFERPLRPS